MNRKLFGEALVSAMKRQQVGQKDLADIIGTSPQYVSAIVRGSKSVSPARIDQIAAAMDLDKASVSRLHVSAARDAGFRLDLPDDFDTPPDSEET